MQEKRILIVEDERIVAEDLKRILQKMGYAVTGVASSGEEAMAKVAASKPDLVLMDIRIKGPEDGIAVAERLYAEHGVPVSYLTAYADAPTLERAKATMPFGYILKPFEARSLQTTIELAIHRHDMERVLLGLDGWHARALNCLPDAVVAADGRGDVMFMNKAAEALTGWSPDAAFGKPLAGLLMAEKQGAHPVNGDPSREPSAPESSGSFQTRNGEALPVSYVRAAMPGEGGEPGGVLVILRKA